ncbi:HAD hydrolase family protein [Streptomyces spinosus]|uniref:HAD hydrolase family protein n=1 Tax=Streptomyces spinosus TaxID=2872623 RepID=UPI001CECB1C8|nr:HAD hydrolase family protein [Streptomyces spinosus]
MPNASVHAGSALRFAAFDLDGTLLAVDGTFRPGLTRRFLGLRRQGVVPLLVTGRTAGSFRHVDPDGAHLGALEDRVLLSDGNVVLDRATGALTTLRSLPAAAFGRLAGAGLSNLVAELDGALIATSRRAALQYTRGYALPRSEVVVDPGLDCAAGTLTGVTVFDSCPDLDALLTGVPHEIDRIGAFGAAVVRPEGTCKASGLAEYLSRYWGRSGLDTVVAFGDAHNDGCLLGSAALGVAVAGADEVAVRHSDIRLTEPIEAFLATFDPDLVRRPTHQAGSVANGGAGEPCFGAHVRGRPAGGDR